MKLQRREVAPCHSGRRTCPASAQCTARSRTRSPGLGPTPADKIAVFAGGARTGEAGTSTGSRLLQPHPGFRQILCSITLVHTSPPLYSLFSFAACIAISALQCFFVPGASGGSILQNNSTLTRFCALLWLANVPSASFRGRAAPPSQLPPLSRPPALSLVNLGTTNLKTPVSMERVQQKIPHCENVLTQRLYLL